MSINNASFEEPGITPGTADEWTEYVSGGSEAIADFTHYDGYSRPWETFEQSWSSNQLYQTAFLTTDIVGALFNGLVTQFEGFEYGWKAPHTPATTPFNELSLFTFYSGWFSTPGFDSGADALEDFEEQWGNSPYNETSEDSLADGVVSAADFDVANDSFEDFEEEWKDCENAISDLDSGSVSSAAFDVVLSFERFDGGNWTTVLP